MASRAGCTAASKAMTMVPTKEVISSAGEKRKCVSPRRTNRVVMVAVTRPSTGPVREHCGGWTGTTPSSPNSAPSPRNSRNCRRGEAPRACMVASSRRREAAFRATKLSDQVHPHEQRHKTQHGKIELVGINHVPAALSSFFGTLDNDPIRQEALNAFKVPC